MFGFNIITGHSFKVQKKKKIWWKRVWKTGLWCEDAGRSKKYFTLKTRDWWLISRSKYPSLTYKHSCISGSMQLSEFKNDDYLKYTNVRKTNLHPNMATSVFNNDEYSTKIHIGNCEHYYLQHINLKNWEFTIYCSKI